jgi:hypothetical protein
MRFLLVFRVVFILIAIAISAQSVAAELPNFNFKHGKPLEFLQYLKENKAHEMYTIGEPVNNWVKFEDLPALIALLNSKEECMSVVLKKSSQIRVRSTVGDEAAFLLEGFRAGMYPATPYSKRLSEKEKAEILTWWQKFLSEHSDRRR